MKQLKVTISVTAFVDVPYVQDEVEFAQNIENELTKATTVADYALQQAEKKGFKTISRNIETELTGE